MENKKKHRLSWIYDYWDSLPSSAKTQLSVYSSSGEKAFTIELFLVKEGNLTQKEINLVKIMTGEAFTFLVYIYKKEEDKSGKFNLEKLRFDIPKLEIDMPAHEIMAPFCPNSQQRTHYTRGMLWESDFSCPLRVSQISDKHSPIAGALTVSRFFEGTLKEALDLNYEVFVYYQWSTSRELLKS